MAYIRSAHQAQFQPGLHKPGAAVYHHPADSRKGSIRLDEVSIASRTHLAREPQNVLRNAHSENRTIRNYGWLGGAALA